MNTACLGACPLTPWRQFLWLSNAVSKEKTEAQKEGRVGIRSQVPRTSFKIQGPLWKLTRYFACFFFFFKSRMPIELSFKAVVENTSSHWSPGLFASLLCGLDQETNLSIPHLLLLQNRNNKISYLRDFPSGPLVMKLLSKCRGCRFDLWSGN